MPTVDELVAPWGDTAFTARQIGDAADVFEQMARDKDCFVVMTLSGALTVADVGLVFCDLIDQASSRPSSRPGRSWRTGWWKHGTRISL